MFNIAVAQSGGPTAAINSSLAGVFTAALECDEIGTIYGSINGIEGVLRDEFVDLQKILTSDYDIDLLMKTPSTVLGSCRFKLKNSDEDDSDYRKAAETFAKHNIKAFFYIGGNDSMDTVMKLDKWFKANNIDIKVVGVPKTIDNDVMATDHTPGFGSAAKYVATSMQEIIRDSRVYSIPSVTIVEIMGRDAGWLTASSCVLRANGEPAPHLIYLPESEFSIEKFLDDIRTAQQKYKAVIIAVSEGIKFDDEKYLASGFSSELTDAFGHKYLSGVGKYLEKIVGANIGCKVRSIELNVMQRCSSHIASLTDITEAKTIGEEAVRAALRGESGVMMVFKRISNNPYRVEVVSADISGIANKEKFFPAEWINSKGNNVTVDALNYFLPLIQGEPKIEYMNGIPVHFRLNQ
ncbi:MAG: 6-phosphofructokinase [Oscillospiraceae bacterium]|nr:6-phosphofructokinase [Oscillospiraceae bacterium]